VVFSLLRLTLTIFFQQKFTANSTHHFKPARTPLSRIAVIHDKNHDIILQEIKTRWIVRLRKLHAAINLANDPNKEFQKFQWLKEHAVITDIEYMVAVTKIKAAQELSLGEKPKEASQNKNYLN
jgi:hypothetical protein